MFFGKSEEEILREAYYGKSKQLKIIEEELEKILNDATHIIKRGKDGVRIISNPSLISGSKRIRNIERLFCEMFNLSEFSLAFYTSLPIGEFIIRPQATAYTWGKGFNLFRKKENWKRIDSTDMFIGVNIDIGIIELMNLNADELLALILHEIGHNMSASPFSLLSQIHINPISTAFNFAMDPLGHGATELNKNIEEFLDNHVNIKRFILSVDKFIANLSILIPSALKFILHPIKLLSNIFSFSNIFGYSEEKYADSFATSYGYGPALSRALAKIDHRNGFKTQHTINKIPGVNYAYDFYKVTSSIMLGIIDEHPQIPVRIISQLKKLKRDLDDPNLDSKQKKMLTEDIQELEKFINTSYLNITKNVQNGRIFTNLYNRLVIKTFKGNVDLRELFSLLNVEE